VVKGLVHPKMKIKSLITYPHAVPTLVCVFGTQMKIFLIKFKRWITATYRLLRDRNLTPKKVNEENV